MVIKRWLLSVAVLAGIMLSLNAAYMPVKAYLAQALLMHAWQQSKATNTGVKPWPWADTEPLGRLNFPQQQTGYIVLAGSMGRTLAFAPGHLTGTARPGEEGHVVVSAHRDSHFNILADVHIGQYIELESRNGHIRRYLVISRDIIDSRNALLSVDNALNKLTLITCYPFDSMAAGGPLRLQIDAIQVSEKP